MARKLLYHYLLSAHSLSFELHHFTVALGYKMCQYGHIFPFKRIVLYISASRYFFPLGDGRTVWSIFLLFSRLLWLLSVLLLFGEWTTQAEKMTRCGVLCFDDVYILCFLSQQWEHTFSVVFFSKSPGYLCISLELPALSSFCLLGNKF